MARSPRPVIYAALAGNVAIAVLKFVAAAITGSAAMLAEGVHSAVDTGNQGLLIGESANREVVENIERVGAQIEGIERVAEVLTMHVGPQFILVALTLIMKKSAPREQAIAHFERQIRTTHPRIKRVFVRVRRPR